MKPLRYEIRLKNHGVTYFRLGGRYEPGLLETGMRLHEFLSGVEITAGLPSLEERTDVVRGIYDFPFALAETLRQHCADSYFIPLSELSVQAEYLYEVEIYDDFTFGVAVKEKGRLIFVGDLGGFDALIWKKIEGEKI